MVAELLLIGGSFCLGFCCYLMGKKSGINEERDRVAWICDQAILEGMSPTVRRVSFSIHDNRNDLVSKEEFFGATNT